MATWTANPQTPTLLDKAHTLDKAIQEGQAKSNADSGKDSGKDKLEPTQAVVSDGQTFEVEGGTVTVAVMEGTPAFAFTAGE